MEEHTKKKSSLKYIVGILVIVGLVLFFTLNKNTHSASTGNIVAVEKGIGDSVNVKGGPNAPVTIIEYGDYQCPFCKRFHDTVLPDLEREYISKGKAKYVFKDFPLSSHIYAPKAAEGAWCAGEQGKFWEMHDIIFANQNKLDANSIKTYATQLGLSAEQFNSCLDSGKMASRVSQGASEGRSIGIGGTPGFSVNGKVFSGVLPLSSWRQLIEYG